MTGVSMIEAGLHFPVLGFPADDDVFPFEHLPLLFGKSLWWAEQRRLAGMDIVDSAGRRWKAVGVIERGPAKKRWWQFGRATEPDRDIELQPFDPEPFLATRQRVEALAGRIFAPDDQALADIRSATDLADLATACFEITVRAQALRILSGHRGIPIRPASEVAARALLLSAAVQLSLGVDKFKIAEWLAEHALSVAMSSDEVELFTKFRLTDQRRAAAGWEVERLIALLWALDFADMPPAGEDPDISTVIETVPPAGSMSVERFLAAGLRPARDLAGMAERYRDLSRHADEEYAHDSSDENAYKVESAQRRYAALQWVINPGRIDWG